MYTVYIIYSKSLNRYYTGYTSGLVVDRLARHMSNHGGYTSNAKDWEVIKEIPFQDKNKAIGEERRIKKRGVTRYLETFSKEE